MGAVVMGGLEGVGQVVGVMGGDLGKVGRGSVVEEGFQEAAEEGQVAEEVKGWEAEGILAVEGSAVGVMGEQGSAVEGTAGVRAREAEVGLGAAAVVMALVVVVVKVVVEDWAGMGLEEVAGWVVGLVAEGLGREEGLVEGEGLVEVEGLEWEVEG